jgi:hypothetical protein
MTTPAAFPFLNGESGFFFGTSRRFGCRATKSGTANQSAIQLEATPSIAELLRHVFALHVEAKRQGFSHPDQHREEKSSRRAYL